MQGTFLWYPQRILQLWVKSMCLSLPCGLTHGESDWQSTYWDICVSTESLPLCPVCLLPIGSLGGISSAHCLYSHLVISPFWLSFSCCDTELRDTNTSITWFNNHLNKLDPDCHQMPHKRRYIMTHVVNILGFRFSIFKLIFISWYNKSS